MSFKGKREKVGSREPPKGEGGNLLKSTSSKSGHRTKVGRYKTERNGREEGDRGGQEDIEPRTAIV